MKDYLQEHPDAEVVRDQLEYAAPSVRPTATAGDAPLLTLAEGGLARPERSEPLNGGMLGRDERERSGGLFFDR
jgi:hypothetical protein